MAPSKTKRTLPSNYREGRKEEGQGHKESLRPITHLSLSMNKDVVMLFRTDGVIAGKRMLLFFFIGIMMMIT